MVAQTVDASTVCRGAPGTDQASRPGVRGISQVREAGLTDLARVI